MNARAAPLRLAFFAALLWLVPQAAPAMDNAGTPLQGGLEINLLPGYAHEPLQGIDSLVGQIAKEGGLTIQYDIGRVSQGGVRLGGDFVNQALALPKNDRLWLKEQALAGRKFHVAYGKDHRLIVSTATAAQGVNFSTLAKTPGDIAEALLMLLSLREQKPQVEEP